MDSYHRNVCGEQHVYETATREDMRAYEELNKGIPDPLPANKVRAGRVGRVVPGNRDNSMKRAE